VDTGSINTGGADTLVLSDGCTAYRHVLVACHADGTRAPVRCKIDGLVGGAAAAGDQIVCSDDGEYEFTPPRNSPLPNKYVHVLGLSDGTLLTISRIENV
jgi:hypothetical protein